MLGYFGKQKEMQHVLCQNDYGIASVRNDRLLDVEEISTFSGIRI